MHAFQTSKIKVANKPGKEMHTADALSHAYLNEHTEDLLGQELELCWIAMHLPVSEENLSVFHNATTADP